MKDQAESNKGIDAEVLDQIHPLLGWAARNLPEGLISPLEAGLRRKLSKLVTIADIIIGGDPIVPVPDYVLQTIKVANRVVSFILDGTTHYGTGILVGPSHVLTAAHLFFEENGLLDPSRAGRTTVVVDTTLLGDVVLKVPRKTTTLIDSPACFVDPRLDGTSVSRPVQPLDFAIVKLTDRIGNDDVGDSEQRGWFEIPTAETSPVLAPGLPLRVFQYLDAKELRVSTGVFRDFTADGFRVAHTASTVDGASGSPLVNDQGGFLALHVSGALSGVLPRSNYALPASLIAAAIDQPGTGGKTIRSLL